MRKVNFLEGLPALNTEIFNRLVKYLTEDLKLRFNDIFEPGILPGYPNFGGEFLITDVTLYTSDPNNKKITFKINPGIAYVSKDNSIIPDPNTNNFDGDNFFERIYISTQISNEYIFTQNTTLYVYISWKQGSFDKTSIGGVSNEFQSLLDGTTLKPFLYDSYQITISENLLNYVDYILLAKINIYQENNTWKSNVDYSGRKYFQLRLRIKEEGLHNYLSYIFKNGVITTRDKIQQKLTYSISYNKLNIQIGDGVFDPNKDLFFINGYIISNFDGLSSYKDNQYNRYTITINQPSSYYLYLQQMNNYGTVTFSLKSPNDVVNDGIKILRIDYNNNTLIVSEQYDIFNIIDPIKTIGDNSIPLKLIKYDNLDLDDKNTVVNIFGNIAANDIQDGFIKGYHIYNKTITTDKIADNAITTDKIFNGAVTDDKITPLNQRRTINYSFPRYITQNITGDITTNTLIKFFIGQFMRLCRITFMFETMPNNSTIQFEFNINGIPTDVFEIVNNITTTSTSTITISNNTSNSINYAYVVIDYNDNNPKSNNITVDVAKLNKGLNNNNGILLQNEILSISVKNINATWLNNFISIELELEECSGDKTNPIIYPNWKDTSNS